MYQPSSFFTSFCLCLAITGITSTLNGCDKVNLDTLLSKDNKDSQGQADTAISKRADGSNYCMSTTQPFSYSLCQVTQTQLSANPDDSGLHLRLFWRPEQTTNSDNTDDSSPPEPLYRFDALKENLPSQDTLIFAANAGMYNSEFAPIGYTVLRGEEIRSLNLKEGGGNFHLMPNGVLWWNKKGEVHITESQALNKMLESNKAKPWFATQSGPMLVIKGDIHPQFNKDSTSLKFRNGVGVCTDGEVKFVNSDEPVNFYQFASLFKDNLGCPNALFLDGGIASALYAPEINVEDGHSMGVIVGLIDQQ